METEKLAKKVKEIKLTKEMQERIIEKCYIETEEKKMSKNTAKNIFKRPMVAVASLALCLSITGVSALAATGKLQGFFKDIKGWNGAVTGTAYEQASEEIQLTVTEGSEALTVSLTMVNPQMAPYNALELLAVESYRIVDLTGKVIVEGDTTEFADVADGKVNISIPLNNIASGEYKLLVSKLVGSAKAEQPLVISGSWECEFTR